MSDRKPIPVPFKRRVELFRTRMAPAVVFGGALLALVLLLHDYAGAPSMVGQAEPLQATVNSFKPGVIAALDVVRFQNVKAGDVLGKVLVTDPKLAQTTLTVIEKEIAALRASMEPVVLQQRRAIDFAGLRLDWMRQRAQLGMARVSKQLAESEFNRAKQLFDQKIGSQSELDFAKAELEKLTAQEKELATLVEEQAKVFESLQLSNGVDVVTISSEPLRAQIEIEEAKLQEAIAEVAPITLRAPVEGMVAMIYRHSGEAVAAGEPILMIAAGTSSRIVGYLRPPVLQEPQVGARVEVRTRNNPRVTGIATVQEVGTQFEMVAPALQMPLKLAATDVGLPVGISIPTNFKIRPGELVELRFLPDATK